MNFKNIYWTYTDTVRSCVDRLLSGRTKWTLHVRKTTAGDYTFSLPWLGVLRESLTGGTELLIDRYGTELLGRVPEAGDRFTINVSSLPIDGASTRLKWKCPDDNWPESNWYVDTDATEALGHEVYAWLCPLLQPMFSGEVPRHLWVQVKHPQWKRDRLKHLVLPFEDPTHPLHAKKPEPDTKVDDDYQDLADVFGDHFADRVYDL